MSKLTVKKSEVQLNSKGEIWYVEISFKEIDTTVIYNAKNDCTTIYGKNHKTLRGMTKKYAKFIQEAIDNHNNNTEDTEVEPIEVPETIEEEENIKDVKMTVKIKKLLFSLEGLVKVGEVLEILREEEVNNTECYILKKNDRVIVIPQDYCELV